MLSDNKINSLLYRIIKGRLRFRVGGLYLHIYEPDSDLIERSYDIYEETYDNSYYGGAYVQEEIINKLIEENIWTPLDDKTMESINKEVEDLKVNCFQNFYKKSELFKLKRQIAHKNKEIEKILTRKHSLDFLSCEYMAETARQNWLIANNCYLDGAPVSWNSFDFNSVYSFYKENILSSPTIREIARSNYWRPIWSAGKKIELFDRPAVDLTRDQITLCSYSFMYDNVYEHPESPAEEVIFDDDCLDGWFIYQRRKHEKEKKSQEVEGLINNPKIKNSKEVFIMAKNKKDADAVTDLNDGLSRSIIEQRKQVIKEKGSVKDTDFGDVQLDLSTERQKKVLEKIRGK